MRRCILVGVSFVVFVVLLVFTLKVFFILNDFWVRAGEEATLRAWTQPVWVLQNESGKLKLDSPYEPEEKSWFKAAIHLHSNNSDDTDPELSVNNLRTLYCKEFGCDVIFVTDHNRVTNTGLAQNDGTCTLGFGVELTYRHGHILVLASAYKDLSAALVEQLNSANSAISIALERKEHLDSDSIFSVIMPSTQQFIDRIDKIGGITILAHPSTDTESDWTQKKVSTISGFHGVEIANNAWGRMAIKTWDSLLSSDYHVYGFANEDFHGFKPWNYLPGRFFNYVLASSNDPADILAGLRKGKFYASTGVKIKSIAIAGDDIRIETQNKSRMRFIGENGRLLHEFSGRQASYQIKGTEKYVRVECEIQNSFRKRIAIFNRFIYELARLKLKFV